MTEPPKEQPEELLGDDQTAETYALYDISWEDIAEKKEEKGEREKFEKWEKGEREKLEKRVKRERKKLEERVKRGRKG